MGEDVLVWLLPEAQEVERARVRRVVTALRLLRDDARPRVARRVEPSWARARGELESLQRAQRLCAIEVLLRAHLEVCLPGDSFLDLGAGTHDYPGAWRRLLAEDGGRAGLPPAPGDAPLVVVEALLAAAQAEGGSRAWSELWGARRQHVVFGAAQAERHWEQLFRRARCEARCPRLQARFLAGLVAARLDLFDPRRALALGAEHSHLVAQEPALRRLLGWSALLCGELAPARAWLAPGASSAAAHLPLPLEELAARRPEWRELLIGRARPRAATLELERGTSRRTLGALLFGVFALRAGGTLGTLVLEAPPALRAQAERRLGARSGAWRRPGEPEHGVLARGVAQEWHRSAQDSPAPAAALGAGRAQALVLLPLLDPAGRAGGWLQLESEHHLLPARARLQSLARAWSPQLRERATPIAVAEGTPHRGVRCEPLAADDPRREFFAHLVPVLERKGNHRRLYWLEPDGEELVVRGESGEGLSDWRARGGGASELGRALAERASRLLPAAGVESGLHAAAASGLVVPLLAARAGEVLGCLVLESERRGDLGASDLARCERTLAELAPRWWTSSFRAWHREQWGVDLAWESEGRFLVSLAPALRAAAATRSSLFLLGPIGAGRRTLSRWLHFLAERRASPWLEGAGAAGPGTRLFELSRCEPGRQRELAHALETGAAGRALFLIEAPPHVLRERGLLARELECRVDPLPLSVPPLAERRDELPALVLLLARDVARREGLAAPVFLDDAMAGLWRQDWRGNVPELASLVAQIARGHPGAEVDGELLRAAFLSRRLAFRERLPSLRPRCADLAAALHTTRHGSGSWNRARAARYLGWDADTLEARLRERALHEHEPGSRVAPARLPGRLDP